MNYRQAAKDLIEQGYAHIPTDFDGVNPYQIMSALKSFFRARRKLQDYHKWQATRPGEREPDVGVIASNGKDVNHAGSVKDDKVYLMFAGDTDRLLRPLQGSCAGTDRQTRSLFGKINILHNHNLGLCWKILQELDDLLGSDLLRAHHLAHRGYPSYATSSTRGMWYQGNGGKQHIDRSALTFHCGDVNGDLYAINRNGERVNVSPPQGKVLVFPGAKAQVAHPRLPALVHGSIAEPGERMALVTFTHVLTNPEIFDSETAVAMGLENYRVVCE